MARNEEKAQSMLNRFLTAKQEEKKKPKERRPFLASECRDLADADKWRQQILREIGRKVTEIQNPGLGEHRLRDLNDEINKLIREKTHWEMRILELDGPNYGKQAPKIYDSEGGEGGSEVAAATGKGTGYRYFGAAKNLPGVKELFDKPAQPKKKRSRYDMFKRIDADYYGYRDDEDGVLEKLERVAEREAVERAVRDWERMQAVKTDARRSVVSGEVARVGEGEEEEEEEEEDDNDDDEHMEDKQQRSTGAWGKVWEEAATHPQSAGREFVAHVPLPDDKEIEMLVLQKKKKELLSKYASDELIANEMEAKVMLNYIR